jgi:hypothetical protein
MWAVWYWPRFFSWLSWFSPTLHHCSKLIYYQLIRHEIPVTLTYCITSSVFKLTEKCHITCHWVKWILLICNCCSGNSYHIVLGANRYDASEIGSLVLATTYSIVHSGYNTSTVDNDIALVRLPTPVTFSSEYCYTAMHMNIVSLFLKQINCFLFTAQTFICLTHLCC